MLSMGSGSRRETLLVCLLVAGCDLHVVISTNDILCRESRSQEVICAIFESINERLDICLVICGIVFENRMNPGWKMTSDPRREVTSQKQSNTAYVDRNNEHFTRSQRITCIPHSY